MSSGSPGKGANAGARLQHDNMIADNNPGNGAGFENAFGDGNGNDSGIGRTQMQPAQSLAEAHPTGSLRSIQHTMAPPWNASPGQVSRNDDYHRDGSKDGRESWSSSASPHLDKGPHSSASSPSTHFTPQGTHSTKTPAAGHTTNQFSPTNISQGVFSVNGNANVPGPRRAKRRRTGPLTPEQRQKAAVMRKVGACQECRRRRVAVSPAFSLGVSTSSHSASVKPYTCEGLLMERDDYLGCGSSRGP